MKRFLMKVNGLIVGIVELDNDQVIELSKDSNIYIKEVKQCRTLDTMITQ